MLYNLIPTPWPPRPAPISQWMPPCWLTAPICKEKLSSAGHQTGPSLPGIQLLEAALCHVPFFILRPILELLQTFAAEGEQQGPCFSVTQRLCYSHPKGVSRAQTMQGMNNDDSLLQLRGSQDWGAGGRRESGSAFTDVAYICYTDMWNGLQKLPGMGQKLSVC